jgi:hypothetical protein
MKEGFHCWEESFLISWDRHDRVLCDRRIIFLKEGESTVSAYLITHSGREGRLRKEVGYVVPMLRLSISVCERMIVSPHSLGKRR